MRLSKVLFLGYGSIAAKHAAVLNELYPEVQLDALRSSSTSKEIEGVNSVYQLQSLDVSSYDFVIVSNPSSLHAESILKIADKASAFFIEKPAFLGLAEGVKVVEAVGTKTNYVACNLRFLDCLAQLKKMLNDQQITPSLVEFKAWSYLPDWRPSVDYRSSYSADASRGGGVIYDLIHEPDYIYWLFGMPIDSTVLASKRSLLEINSCDTATMMFSYKNSIVQGSLSYASRINKRSLRIVAEEGVFEIDLLKNTITHNGIVIFSSVQRIFNTYQSQILHFVNCLEGNCKPLNDVNQSLDLMRLLHLE